MTICVLQLIKYKIKYAKDMLDAHNPQVLLFGELRNSPLRVH